MKEWGLLKKVKTFFIKLAAERASANEISIGVGIGVFFSVFPTFGVGVLLVMLLYRFLKFNLIAALGMSVVSNPLTSPFFILLSYRIGSLILNKNIEFNAENWKENLGDTGIVVFTGAFIVSGCLAVLAFFISKFVVERFRKKPPKNENTD